MTQPITPQELRAAMSDSIPDFVFEVVNDMLVEKMSRSTGEAVLKQDDIAKAVRQHPEYKQLKPRPDIYHKHWMDFEDHYRKAGWVVEYDRPAYNESYQPTFLFRARV